MPKPSGTNCSITCKDPIIIILIAALLITVVLWMFGYAHWYESVGIAFAVVIATWLEHSNEQSFQRLLEEALLIRVKVFRNGHLTEIPIND
ncbi:MAG: hypothetical protein WAV07_13625 [Candidatus Contendobacter sp.]